MYSVNNCNRLHVSYTAYNNIFKFTVHVVSNSFYSAYSAYTVKHLHERIGYFYFQGSS